MYQNVHFKKDMVKGHQAIPFLLNDATDSYQLFLLDTNRMVLGIIYNSNNGIMPITALQIVFVFSIILIVFYHYFISINAFIFLFVFFSMLLWLPSCSWSLHSIVKNESSCFVNRLISRLCTTASLWARNVRKYIQQYFLGASTPIRYSQWVLLAH